MGPPVSRTTAKLTVDVTIGGAPVGRLGFDNHGRSCFVFFERYEQTSPRPVLGQFFEDGLERTYIAQGGRLPAFFANLLPEGALREAVTKSLGLETPRDLVLLAELGEDLPGAVVIGSDSESGPLPGSELSNPTDNAEDRDDTSLHFSLAGVQLKFSVLREEGGALTFPARGVGGNEIVKLPSREHAGLPMNEHAMMTWARAVGIDAPATRVVPVGEVRKLPVMHPSATEAAFVISRFDRGPGGQRIHIEDMAQVFGFYPTSFEKYQGTKERATAYQEMAALVFNLCGVSDFEELVRRLVFNAAIGNADAHYKNWSLIYADGFTARLSPAYDLVATCAYISDDRMAVRLFGTRKWRELHASSFDLLADHVGHPRAAMRAVVEHTLDRAVATAREIRDRFPLRPGDWDAIAQHWKRVPLLRGRVLFG